MTVVVRWVKKKIDQSKTGVVIQRYKRKLVKSMVRSRLLVRQAGDQLSVPYSDEEAYMKLNMNPTYRHYTRLRTAKY